jgi:hypothetical protein
MNITKNTQMFDLRSLQLGPGLRVVTGGINVNIFKFILKNKNRKI